MKVRLLLVLTFLAVVVGTLFLVVETGPPVELDEVSLRDHPGEHQAMAPADEGQEEKGRAAIQGGRKNAAPAPGFPEVTAGATGRETVLVRIRFTLAGERTPFSSGRFRGREVELQSWHEEGDETFLHQAVIDERDVAELEFPGAVHLDWIRFEPSLSTGLGIALSEEHIDLEPGSLYEVTLPLGPASTVTGRVLLENGWPAEGVTVQARRHPGGGVQIQGMLDDWHPGHARTRTLVDGSFAFANLSGGVWSIAVTLSEWLQADPSLGRAVEGRNWLLLLPGEAKDLGVFRITPLQRFLVRVTDATCEPAPDICVRLEPLGFRSPHLTWRPLEKEKPDSVGLWLRGEAPAQESQQEPEEPRIEWPYGVLELRTDTSGEVECRAVAGVWELAVQPGYDSMDRTSRTRVTVPCGDQTLALPTVLADFDGTVVDEQGRPVQFALVTASRRGDELSMMTDPEGEFRFVGLDRGRSYALKIEHLRYLTETYSIQSGGSSTPRRFELRRSETLSIRAVDPTGAPLSDLRFELISGTPALGVGAFGAETRAWFEALPRGKTRHTTDSRGAFRIHQLHPGEYELALFLPVATGGTDDRGRPNVERPLWQKWVVSTEEDKHVLTVDLSGYQPPPGPVYAVQGGVVRDARTGQPVARANINIRRGSNWFSTRAGKNGEFEFSVPPGELSFLVLHDDYLPLSIEPVPYLEGEHHHEFALEPGGNEVRITIRGRDGGSLPDLDVELSSYALTRPPDQKPVWDERTIAHEGVLRVGRLPAGSLTVTVGLDAIELGEHTVEVLSNRDVQELEIRLEQTVDEIRATARREWEHDQGGSPPGR